MPRASRLPSRLHHTAYTTKDMEKTRRFYEDVIGLPLVATWSESDKLFGKMRTYCHCFFGLADGGALAFDVDRTRAFDGRRQPLGTGKRGRASSASSRPAPRPRAYPRSPPP